MLSATLQSAKWSGKPYKKEKRVLATFWPVSAGSTLSKSLLTTLENVSTQRHLSRTFYDQSYAIGKTEKTLIPLDEQGVHVTEREVWVQEPRNTPIPVDEQGRCAVAQEMGERDQKTRRPSKWKCTCECKFPTKEERQRIVDLKTIFESVRTLRRVLDAVDSGCCNGHYTCSTAGHDLGDDPMVRDLAGHPLMCSIAGCESKLRTFRAAAPHTPLLRRLLSAVYEAIRYHKLIASIDSSLHLQHTVALVTTQSCIPETALRKTVPPSLNLTFRSKNCLTLSRNC